MQGVGEPATGQVLPFCLPPGKNNVHKAWDTFGTRCPPPMPLSLQAFFKEHLTLSYSFIFLGEINPSSKGKCGNAVRQGEPVNHPFSDRGVVTKIEGVLPKHRSSGD